MWLTKVEAFLEPRISGRQTVSSSRPGLRASRHRLYLYVYCAKDNRDRKTVNGIRAF